MYRVDLGYNVSYLDKFLCPGCYVRVCLGGTPDEGVLPVIANLQLLLGCQTEHLVADLPFARSIDTVACRIAMVQIRRVDILTQASGKAMQLF